MWCAADPASHGPQKHTCVCGWGPRAGDRVCFVEKKPEGPSVPRPWLLCCSAMLLLAQVCTARCSTAQCIRARNKTPPPAFIFNVRSSLLNTMYILRSFQKLLLTSPLSPTSVSEWELRRLQGREGRGYYLNKAQHAVTKNGRKHYFGCLDGEVFLPAMHGDHPLRPLHGAMLDPFSCWCLVTNRKGPLVCSELA